MMLTDQQILLAAKKLCELRGIDPNEINDYDRMVWETNTKIAEREIRKYLQVLAAIESVNNVNSESEV